MSDSISQAAQPGHATSQPGPQEAHPDREMTAKGQVTLVEATPAQRAVIRRTAEARATVPDLECSRDVEVSDVLARCEREGVSLDGLLAAACATALRAVPRANAAYRDGRYELYCRVNLGIVVAREDTYVIPTVFDADLKSPADLTAEIARLTEQALARELPSPAFSGATFTLWNAGACGLTRSGMVINPPQAGALAAGAVRPAPIVREGGVVPGALMTLTLACDHRILYGELAGRFLAAVATGLTNP